MPETRTIKEYTDGVLVNEIPYEVSDKQLDVEQAINNLVDLLPQARHLFKDWDTATSTEKDRVLKAALAFMIVGLAHEIPDDAG
jgi:hypothetical protein